ncbi:MAG: preprotein translocase subunit SecG [Chitinophagales bacterium]
MVYTVIIIVMLIVAVLLGLVILIQNPKGGGLNASLGSVGNSVFGASRSTDIVEKATWYLAIAILVLSLVSVTQIGSADDMTSPEKTRIDMVNE